MEISLVDTHDEPRLKRVTKAICKEFEYLERLRLGKNEYQFPMSYEAMNRLFEIRNEYNWSDRVFTKNGKKGLKNATGKILVPALYDDFVVQTDYHDDDEVPATAKLNGYWGMVKRDGTGTPLTAFEYYKIRRFPFSTFFIVVKEDDPDHFAIMLDGELLTPFELDTIYEPMNGVLLLGIGDKVGVLTVNELLYIKPEYDLIYPDEDDVYYIFEKDGEKGRVTLDKRFISNYVFNHFPERVQEALDEIGFIQDWGDW